VAETSSLLRNRTFIRTEGSNPSLSAIGFLFYSNARVAQLDRVPGYEPGGRRFESFHAHHTSKPTDLSVGFFVFRRFLLSLMLS
jgi:hypothetical protein